MKILEGYKTYVLALGAAVIFILARSGVIEPETEIEIYKALSIAGVGTVAHKLNRIAG